MPQLRRDILKRKFHQPLVSKTELLGSMNTSFVGLSQQSKFRSFHHAIRLLEHAGYRTLVTDEKEKIEQDEFAWLTLLPSTNENIIDISSLAAEGVNINSLSESAIYLDIESEHALTELTANLEAAISEWHLTFEAADVAEEPIHIYGTCPAISYSIALVQWHLDQVYIDYYGGAIVAGIRITNECFPIVELYFHDTDINPNIPDCFLRMYTSDSVMWAEIHKSKDQYMAYIDLLRNEYPISVRYDTTKKSIVDILASGTDVGWAYQ